jgi:integrase
MIRVYDRHGRSFRRSLGTSEHPELAEAVEKFVKGLRTAKRWDVLDVLIARLMSPYQAFIADVDDSLAEKLEGFRRASVEAAVEAADTDISPLVDSLVDDLKYRQQIRRFIPEGESFGVSKFTTKAIAGFLHGLEDARSSTKKRMASAATRDRYKAALSYFANRLVEHGHLERNPTRDIQGTKKPLRPIRYLEPEQVRALVDALPFPNRALEALLAGTGMEVGAAFRLTRRDVDEKTRIVLARGTKNQYRTRYVEVSEPWAWEIFWQYAKDKTPNTVLFAGLNYGKVRRPHDQATKAMNLPPTTIHMHRHSYGVMHVKRGSDEQWLKNQFGHAPQSTLMHTIYGLWINAAKLTKSQLERMGKTSDVVTTSVTIGEK